MSVKQKTADLALGCIVIDEERCKGCGLCIKSCPKSLLEISKSKINAKGYIPIEFNDADRLCTGCSMCAIMCPDLAIKVYKRKKI